MDLNQIQVGKPVVVKAGPCNYDTDKIGTISGQNPDWVFGTRVLVDYPNGQKVNHWHRASDLMELIDGAQYL